MGYHLRDIKKGVFGDFSKVQEEFEEVLESREQSNPIMELVELSDLIGAIEGYVTKHFSLDLDALIRMKDATHRAFEDGTRTTSDPGLLSKSYAVQDSGYGNVEPSYPSTPPFEDWLPENIKPDSLGHRTRYSDSSFYDEVCVLCRSTDGYGDAGLSQPCPNAIP